MVDLGNEACESTRCHVNLLAIVGAAGSIDVEASEDLADVFVDSQDDLGALCQPAESGAEPGTNMTALT